MADTWYTMSNYYGYDTSHTTPISNGYNTSAQYTKCHNYGWHEVYNANLLR